jgi:hypothetical protein
MLRKIGLTLFCAIAFLSTPSFSMMTHSLQAGVTLEYDLPSHDPQVFINYMFWTVEANCKITSEDEKVDLFVEALSKKGKVNDVTLYAGQSMRVSVQSGQNLKISADSGAKVQITTVSDHNAHATCSS